MRIGIGKAVVQAINYHANVQKGDRYWVISVAEIDRSTQARHLRELEAMTEDLISVVTGTEPDSFTVNYQIQLPESVEAHMQLAQRLREEAARAQVRAAAESRAAARELREQGMPVRDIGRALGISYQRAHQLVS